MSDYELGNSVMVVKSGRAASIIEVGKLNKYPGRIKTWKIAFRDNPKETKRVTEDEIKSM